MSRLARALWIEITHLSGTCPQFGSRLARALWIEICVVKCADWIFASRLARALWIEIKKDYKSIITAFVEARESLVD